MIVQSGLGLDDDFGEEPEIELWTHNNTNLTVCQDIYRVNLLHMQVFCGDNILLQSCISFPISIRLHLDLVTWVRNKNKRIYDKERYQNKKAKEHHKYNPSNFVGLWTLCIDWYHVFQPLTVLWVNPVGTTLVTDFWRSYLNLPQYGYRHRS